MSILNPALSPNVVIQLRGTSGSGKSTVVRTVMDSLYSWDARYVEGRRKPLYYAYHPTEPWPPLHILGHYETDCGGCDTVGSAKAVYDLIRTLPDVPILCEGLLLSEDTKWTGQLYEEGRDVRCLFLTTTEQTCLQHIRERRARAGNPRELNPHNTTQRIPTIDRARVKLLERGVGCRRASPAQAPSLILHWLRELSLLWNPLLPTATTQQTPSR